VRVIAGERTGYAYSDDLSPEKIRKAARVAAHIARGPSQVDKFEPERRPAHNLYPVLTAPTETAFAERVELVKRADRAARAYDSRIFQVQASLRRQSAPSDGGHQRGRAHAGSPAAGAPQRLRAGAGGRRDAPQRGHAGGGGRVELDFFLRDKTPEHFAQEAAREAIAMLDSVEAPAGEMTVVLGPGWPGILLHEAVGHGLEADFNRKGVSAFSGRIGQRWPANCAP
jgi:TldD protein